MNTLPRRSVLAASLTCCSMSLGQEAAKSEEHAAAAAVPVTAPEDLMREHGVLNRLMLVYEAALSPSGLQLPNVHEVFHATASLIRSFIEDYHGMLEEKFVFPEFERRRSHVALVSTLREQHRIGRMLTGVILKHTTRGTLADEAVRAETTRAVREFIRMFRAHEAWEDTELFPAFRSLVTPAQLLELGEQFEDIEHKTFGEDGFADTVQHISQLEHRVGIRGLDIFTAHERGETSR